MSSEDKPPLKKAQEIVNNLENQAIADKWFDEHQFITVINDETGLQKIEVIKI